MSTKPGVTIAPSASTSRRPDPATRPTSTITPLSTATSATRPGAPVPSMTVPPRTTRSTVTRPVLPSAGRLSAGAELPAGSPRVVLRGALDPRLRQLGGGEHEASDADHAQEVGGV